MERHEWTGGHGTNGEPGASRTGVAIVGMGCRLPGGVSSPTQLVDFLRHQGDGVTDIPGDRWNSDLYYHPDPAKPGKAYVKRAAFLQQDVFSFDPMPFGVSPREADYLDPQQRLLLEVSWEAFEDAGIPVDALRGSNTGVFVGGFTLDFQNFAYSAENRPLVSAHTSVGASLTLLSNRISYTFDLHGPSLTIDTACSSSLVAAHLACEAILRGDCDLAVVGGVNVMLSPSTFVAMCKGHFLAADGRSKTFDATADGYGRGEGAAVLVLKQLDAALRDGDRVYATIVASGINQDGRTDGVPMPNELAQRALSARVLSSSGLLARDIGYVEAHGTGTKAGDPLEMRALAAVYGQGRDSPLFVGAIKTNVGHLEAAAGVTGLMKAALSVWQREIFPLRALGTPNPEIPFGVLNLAPATSRIAWPTREQAHAAVNAFGYGGTNAHVILSEARNGHAGYRSSASAGVSVRHGIRLIPISAATPAALIANAAQTASAITDTEWLEQASTLARRRAHLHERAVILASSAEELRSELRGLVEGTPSNRCIVGRAGSDTRLLWVFTGMGPQWWGMGQDLYQTEPVFRDHLERADRAFRDAAGWSILEEMLLGESASRMASNAIAQPANFVLQVALVGLLRSLGVPEHGMLGHSVGEVAAAWASGCLSLEQAAFVACHRSRLQQQVAGKGTMLAAALSSSEAEELVKGTHDVVIAAYNAPRSVALAGARSELEQIASDLEARGIFSRMMPVEVAYHSPHIAPLESGFRASLGSLRPGSPGTPLYSTARGVRIKEAAHDAQYWWENAREPVLLQRALELAIADGFTAFLEIGPHPVLSAAIREVLAHRSREGRTYASLNRRDPEQSTILTTVAELSTSGATLDWSKSYPDRVLSDLPKYPFQRDHHWTESDESRDQRLGRPTDVSFLSDRDSGPTARFTADLVRPSLAYLFDHRIQGAVVFPAAGYVDALLSAAVEIAPDRQEHVLEDLTLDRALLLETGNAVKLLVDVAREQGALFVHSRRDAGSWEEHARARIVTDAKYQPLAPLHATDNAQRLGEVVEIADFYARLRRIGLEYGPHFQKLASLRVRHDQFGEGTMLARLSPGAPDEGNHSVHPAILDAAIHALLALVPDLSEPMIPVSIERIRWTRTKRSPVFAYATASVGSTGDMTANLSLADASGEVVIQLRGLVCRRLGNRRAAERLAVERLLHVDTWQEAALPERTDPRARRWALAGTAHAFLASLERSLSSAGADVVRWDIVAGVAPAPGSIVVFAADSRGDDPVGMQACGALVQAAQKSSETSCSLRVVTLGAHAIVESDVPRPDQTALWGLARVVMTEQPELGCRLIDLSPHQDGTLELAGVLAMDAGEEEAALRGGRFHVRRLRRLSDAAAAVPPVAAAEHHGAYTLQFDAKRPGRAAFVASARRAPAAGEVEIAVLAAALDRRDLQTDTEQPDLPRSVAGVVSAVGEGIYGVQVGDSVHALCTGPLASHIVANESRLTPLPPQDSAAEAVGYADFFAAWHAVFNVARVEPHERVLIHGADTSLGLACVQVARIAGAEVIATSDSPEPDHGIAGAARVYSSRTSDFIEDIKHDSAEAAVPVILSTRPGGAGALLSLVAPGGRYVDLDIRDRDHDERLAAKLLRRGFSFSTVDLLSLVDGNPEAYAELTREVLQALTATALVQAGQPTFRAGEVALAATELANADAHASVVLDLSTGDALVDVTSVPTTFREDRTYVVTGGLAGFGLATAAWLIERGARHLVLASRRGDPDAEGTKAIAAMQSVGARVHCRRLDVADEASVEELLDYVDSRLPPLAGVFHSAVVLEDGPVTALNTASLARVMLPKALGAWHLYQKTANRGLDHLVFYSSVSALIGNPNQAAYAAANSFLDGLCMLATARGSKATTISWGALGDVGLVARSEGTEKHLKRLGIQPIPARVALSGMERVLAARMPRAGVFDMHWDQWIRCFPDTSWHRLAEVATSDQSDLADEQSERLRAELAGLTEEEKRSKVRESVLRVACAVLRIRDGRLDCGASLRDFGLDSLMAVELQMGLEHELGVLFPAMLLLASVSIDSLTERIVAEYGGALEPSAVRASPAAATEDLRTWFLSRICVQPPYFALDDFTRDGEWIEASATPLPPNEDESDAVSCAEAARHLAIVGSCAVSLKSIYPGRVYYPVLRAHYPDLGSVFRDGRDSSPDVLAKVRVRARCLEFDPIASRATAETELQDTSGNPVLKMLVDYHVIPEADFTRLFAAHAEPTREGSGLDPYLSWDELPECEEHGREFRMDLGVVAPDACLGHFVGYPALPVSIMARHAIRLIADGIRRTTGFPQAKISVRGGVAQTHSFVFAHERARLQAVPLRRDGDSELWRCNVLAGERVAASFELSVTVMSQRFSGFRVARAQERTG